jgi:transposase
MAKYDLEAIEADYRADQLSNRAISTKHGCSEASIRKWATKFGWQKDLSGKVKQATKAKLTKAVAETTPTAKEREPNTPLSDEEIVEEASNAAVDVITSHRTRTAEYQGIVRIYGSKLREQLDNGKLKVLAPNGDPIEIDIPLEYIGKCLNSATQSLERLIKLERQAYNLDDQQDSSYEDDLEALSEGL